MDTHTLAAMTFGQCGKSTVASIAQRSIIVSGPDVLAVTEGLGLDPHHGPDRLGYRPVQRLPGVCRRDASGVEDQTWCS